MRLCLEHARKGLGGTAPNPMVGCVIVCGSEIIGEGHHEKFGGPHAEVNAINSVMDKSLLKQSVLYVNLEPCAHTGKTPPCSSLIIEHGIKEVVIANTDPNPLVNGKGIKLLEAAGCNVTTGVLEKEGRELNRRFFCWHENKRPFVILKWAQSTDGFIDSPRYGEKHKPLQISNLSSKKLLHRWRSEEQAILVGTNTALMDNPKLTVREWQGNNPLRIVPDKWLRIPSHFHILDKSTPTLVFTSLDKQDEPNLEYIKIDFEGNVANSMLEELYRRNVQSLIVEGGEILLNRFITQQVWDEARVFVSPQKLGKGIKAPLFPYKAISEENIDGDSLFIYKSPLREKAVT